MSDLTLPRHSFVPIMPAFGALLSVIDKTIHYLTLLRPFYPLYLRVTFIQSGSRFLFIANPIPTESARLNRYAFQLSTTVGRPPGFWRDFLMADQNHSTPSSQEPSFKIESSDRLESWKEISSYLKRDIRTVRRWEKNEGLPIHRHMHQKLPTVYAFKTELDAWQEKRQPRRVEQKVDVWSGSRRRLGWVAVTLSGAVLIGAGIMYFFTQSSVPSVEGPRWVLIARFENRTGEPVFDGTLEYALERELANAQLVNVVPKERILDALQLMKKPPDAVLESSVGREICLRDGGIQVLVTGRVEKLASTYILSVVLINPADGVTMASFSEEADSQTATVPAVRGLARRVRAALGEALTSIDLSLEKLEKVSTPSLRALHLYSQADELIREHKSGQAAPLLQEAIQEDPNFASAHVLLAYSLSHLGRQEEAGPHYARAVELAETTTDRERYFILASHYQRNERNIRRAIENLELLLRLYPDHYWAASNLAAAYLTTGQPDRALSATVKRADLRPNYFDHQLGAAQALAARGDPRQAEPYLRRAQEMVLQGRVDSWRSAALRLFPAHERWLKGDLEMAFQEVTKVKNEILAQPKEPVPQLRFQAGSMFLILGKLESATRLLAGSDAGGEEMALLALALGDSETALKYLNGAPPTHRTAILLARLGQVTRAESTIASPEAASRAFAPFIPGVWEKLARGELELARGNTAEAIPQLEMATESLRPWPTSFYFLGIEALANALERQGNLQKSLEIMEEASRHKLEAVFWGPAPYFWLKLQLQRARLYRKLGRPAEAEVVESGLLSLLALADQNAPLPRSAPERTLRNGRNTKR